MPREVVVTGGPGFSDYQEGRNWLRTSEVVKKLGFTRSEEMAARTLGRVYLRDARKRGLVTQPKTSSEKK